MSEPTKAEVDEVSNVVSIVIFPHLNSYSTADSKALARSVIIALDKIRGECVPVNKLREYLEQSHQETVFGLADRLLAWLDRKGWRDG